MKLNNLFLKFSYIFKLSSRANRFFCYIVVCYGLYIIINLTFNKDIFFTELKTNSTLATEELEANHYETLTESSPSHNFQVKLKETIDNRASNIFIDVGQFNYKSNVNYSKNCGLLFECSDDEYPVHLFTGRMNTDKPKMCINHQYSALPFFQKLGRGFNVAVVNPNSMKVVRFGNFDTYQEDSKNLEVFLELVEPGFVIIVVVHDDAALRLTLPVRNILAEFGSSLINNLAFRDVWVFVGRRGLLGYSPVEQIEYAIKGWPQPIDLRTCVKRNFTGVKAKADDVRGVNEKRRKFCFVHQFDNGFCRAENIDKPLVPSLLFDATLEKHLIFQTPIVIVPGTDINLFQLQVEALLLNTGLTTNQIHVFVPAQEITIIEFSVLLDLQVHLLHNISFQENDYADIFLNSFDQSWKMLNSQYIMFVEEHVIPSNNFLSFMAQCMDVLDVDHSLMAASAWNPLGLSFTPGNEKKALRSGIFPGLGFIMNRRVYNKYLKHHLFQMNHKSALDGWSVVPDITVETIHPEVSRVYRVLQDSNTTMAFFTGQAVSIDRKLETKMSDLAILSQNNYSRYMQDLISNGVVVPEDVVRQFCYNREKSCNNTEKQCKTIDELFDNFTGSPYIIKYMETSESSALSQLLTCLTGIDLNPNHGLLKSSHYKHLIKLSLAGRDIIFIESKSPYNFDT